MERRRAVINTEKSKGRRPFREIFWTQTTNNNIWAWLRKRDELKKAVKFTEPEALFISATGLKIGNRLSIKGVGEMLRRYSNNADIPYMNAHSFRHRMGHHIIKNGGSSADVMNILGHSSVQSTTIYTMMADNELEKRYRHFMRDAVIKEPSAKKFMTLPD